MRKYDTQGYEIISPPQSELPVSPLQFQSGGGSTMPVAGMISATAPTTLGLTANRLYAMPYIVPRRTTQIQSISINVTTLVAASNCRVGLYNNTALNNLYPKDLLYDSGAISSASTGVKTGTPGTAIEVVAGDLYWLTVESDAAISIRALAVSGMYPMLGLDSALGTALGVGWFVAHAFGALPNPYTGGGTVQTGTSPAIALALN